MRAMAVAVSVLFVLIPDLVTGQTSIAAPAPFSLQAGAGPTLIGGGNVLSAAFGYSPASRVDLLLNVERNHLPFRLTRFPEGGYSVTRGGTLTFVSGELRAALRPPNRVSPYVIAGVGGGVSRPNVNDQFPYRVSNDLRVLYFGGGVRVPPHRGFSLFGDVRAMLGVEGYDGVLAVWPVRVGAAWRF